MDQMHLWKRYCELVRFYPEVGLSLDISRVRFPDDFFQRMGPSMNSAFEAMDALERGEVANPDEGRMVGHYWLRTPDLSPTSEVKSAIVSTVEQIKAFAAKIHSGAIAPEKGGKFEHVVVVGIGGSALGPQLVSDALGTPADRMRLWFCDNTDPDGILRLEQQLDAGLAKALVITISKSGGTLETRNGCFELATAFRNRGLTFERHAVAVTCPGSKLDEQAKSQGWLERIPMWDWVGGRTSLFSSVGLLPAALQGLDIEAFLAGARAMDAITRKKDVRGNPASLLALMWHFSGDGRGKKDMVVLPYKDRLVLFSKYLQQLVMESLGKEKDLQGKTVNQGIAVYGNKGSTDQHAYVQQLRDGLNNFFATFIHVLGDFTNGAKGETVFVEPSVTSGDYLTGFYLGTRRALYENNRDSISLTVDRLDTKTLGALIALYDRAVGLYASLVGINAYHQPGVEAGKKAAARVIELQKGILAALEKASGPESAEQIAKAVGASEEVETVYHILEHLVENAAHPVRRSGERSPVGARYEARS